MILRGAVGLLLLLPCSALAQDRLAEARALVAAQQWQQANERLSSLVGTEPGNLPAWQLLGEVQLAQSLNDDALNSFETVLKGDPGSAAAQAGEEHAAVAAALADRSAGDPNRALATLLRARKLVPHSIDVLVAIGIQGDSMQLYKDADEALKEALRLEPQNAKALYALAHVELDEQQMAGAEEHLRAYLKLRPEDATAHYGLGHLLHMVAKNDEAQAELQRSIALRPQQSESYYELGQIALEQNDTEAAKKYFAQVLEMVPNHGGALTGMGILAFRAKDMSLAEQYLKQAVLYAPDYVTAHHYYGMTLARLGRVEESKQEQALADRLTEQQNKMRHGYQLLQGP